MSTNAPSQQLEEALKLEADAEVTLWEVRLKGVPLIYRFWNGPTREWNGETWEGLPNQLSGEERSSEKSARPTLSVHSPAKIFGPFAAEGYFDLADLIRYRVLQQHFLNNVALYERRVFITLKPSLVKGTLQLELRSPLDMPPWKTPRGVYNAAQHPFVTI